MVLLRLTSVNGVLVRVLQACPWRLKPHSDTSSKEKSNRCTQAQADRVRYPVRRRLRARRPVVLVLGQEPSLAAVETGGVTVVARHFRHTRHTRRPRARPLPLWECASRTRSPAREGKRVVLELAMAFNRRPARIQLLAVELVYMMPPWVLGNRLKTKHCSNIFLLLLWQEMI